MRGRRDGVGGRARRGGGPRPGAPSPLDRGKGREKRAAQKPNPPAVAPRAGGRRGKRAERRRGPATVAGQPVPRSHSRACGEGGTARSASALQTREPGNLPGGAKRFHLFERKRRARAAVPRLPALPTATCDGRRGGSASAGARRDHRGARRAEEHTSELQSPCNLVCRLLLEKKKNTT